MLSQFLSQIDVRTRPKLSKAMGKLADYIQVHSKGLGGGERRKARAAKEKEHRPSR